MVSDWNSILNTHKECAEVAEKKGMCKIPARYTSVSSCLTCIIWSFVVHQNEFGQIVAAHLR